MSLSIAHAQSIAASLEVEPIPNFIAQAKAKQLLQEVNEAPGNFPDFTRGLDERVTFVAYRKLAVGCSLIEQDQELESEGHTHLHSAGDLLESVHQSSFHTNRSSSFHCLVGAMAFYACGHYSRAFVLIKDVDIETPVAGIVASFLRKDASELIPKINEVLLAEPTTTQDSPELDERALNVAIARAVAFIFEHTISGDADLLQAADSTLADAMLISESANYPSYWWISRLLRLMFHDYGRSSLWNVLPPWFGPDGQDRIKDYVSLLALSSPPVVELWRSQLECLQLALDEENMGGVFNLRTSAGKTRVAELAIIRVLQADPTAKIFYLAPFRSLAFELERTFAKYLGTLGYSISHLYGGSRFSGVDRKMVQDANLLIATPEKTKAMLRAAPELFENVRLVVVDEGHLLGENSRNVRNELFLEHLRLLCRTNDVRMLLLSAVLPNASLLAQWIGGRSDALVKSDWKPSDERFGVLRWSTSGVRIDWSGESSCFNPHFVEFKQVTEPGKRSRKFPRSKTEAVAATAVRLSELGPVLIFVGQAQWVPSMAKAVMLALASPPSEHPWPEAEWRLFEAICREELGAECIELNAARLGIVCHSNRLPPQVRIAIEKLLAARAPRIIVATTTLGQGVNIGISSVIVAQTLIGKNHWISKRDFWNICGRAGRALVDGEGKVLYAIDATKHAANVRAQEARANAYLDINNLEKINSGLFQLLRAIMHISEKAGIAFEVLIELIANGDFSRFGKNAGLVRAYIDLIDDQLLAFHLGSQGSAVDGESIDRVEAAFQDSLAAIQESKREDMEDGSILSFIRARTSSLLREVPTTPARHAIVASGLPPSVGNAAFQELDEFRAIIDMYLSADGGTTALNNLVSHFENWARINAGAICDSIPDQELLDAIRPHWLDGTPLYEITEEFGTDSLKVCTQFYGYELSWLFHAIAQQLNRQSEEQSEEEPRVEVLSLVSLLLELGLPTECSSKIFLAGVRSRAAAIELGKYVSNASASVARIRGALLNPENIAKLKPVLSAEAAEWLDVLAKDRRAEVEAPPNFSRFKLKWPLDATLLHARKLADSDMTYLCSTDGRVSVKVQSTEKTPFDSVANDPRFVFVKSDKSWRLHCRDPRMLL